MGNFGESAFRCPFFGVGEFSLIESLLPRSYFSHRRDLWPRTTVLRVSDPSISAFLTFHKKQGTTVNCRPPLFPSQAIHGGPIDSHSKTQVQAKLDLPGRKHDGSNLSGSGGTDRRVGSTVVLNVERVKEFRPERNEKSLTNWKILEHGEIRVIYRRRPQDISPNI